jgi:hypothetical protein
MRPLGAARAALARAEGAGIRFRLLPGDRVRVEADAPPPPDLLAELRRWRDEVAALLAEREGRPARETPPTAAPSPVEAEAEAAPARDPAKVAELAAGLLRLAAAGAAALAAPDAELELERAAIAEVRAAEAAGEVPVKPEADHRRHLAGLLRSALMRPPSWEGGAPPPGTWCSCCSGSRAIPATPPRT